MVVKIYKAAPSCSSAVNYNERKVAEGHASVIFSSGIDNPRRPMDTFSIYERGSLRCQNKSFHASVNPGKDDGMTDEKVREVIKAYMEKMGYGGQPYIVYKHTDLERIHYHIVSVRVDRNGKKIPDNYERKRSQEALKELSKEFGFELGKKKDGEEEAVENDFNPYDGFDPDKGDVGMQVEEIAKLALGYYFKEPEQFDLIMEDLGVKVNRGSFEGHDWMTLQGLDPTTKEACTPQMEPQEELAGLLERVDQHARACKGQIKTREKERVSNIAKTALGKVRSEKNFKNYLRKFGICVVLSRNVNRQIFGATFIDHQTKCVFKAGELPKFSAKMIEEARRTKWYGEGNDENSHSRTAAEETADILLSALGAERSRRHEDEEIMRRGRKGPRQ